MSKKNSNNIKKNTVSSGNKFSDDSVINEMDVLPSTKSIKIPIKFNVDFDPLIGYVNSEVTLAMSPDSTGLFTIGNNVDKYTGISKEETKKAVESGMETPDDAVIYGMCNVMNNGDDIFFWTNGIRLAGAADKVGVLSGVNELLTHECLHLTRTILNKHILKNKGIVKWAESDWLSIGDQDDDIQEESFATALGLITEQVTPKFIEMASEYIPELKNSTLPKAQEGLDFQSRLNQFLKPSTFSPNILGRSSGRNNVGYEYKAGPFTQSTMFASDRRLAPVDKFTFASDNPTNTQLSLNTGLNYKDKYGFKGAASYANTTAKNDPNAKFNVGYNRKGLTADYNYNYNKENPSYNLGAGYRGQGVTADFKMSKDKKTPYTYDTNVGYELDGVSGKFGFTGNKETPKYTFGVGYDRKGVTGEFTATKDQKKPFVYNANLGYNKDGFSTGLEFSGNKENPNYTYRVKYEPEKQGFTTDSNLEFTKGNIDATTGLGYKNKNINTGLSYKTSIDRENESQQNSLGANFGYRNKNFNTGVNYERRFATEEDPASNKIGVNVGYRNKSGIGVNAGVDYKTLSESQKLQDKASPFEFRAGVTYTPQRKRQQTPTKKFTFSKEDVKKEPIDIKDLPEFKKRFGGQHIYHDLFQKGGRKTKNGITILNPIEEATYQDWRKSLPSNLQNDTSGYDLRGAWVTGIQPELFYYDEQGKFQSAHPIDVNEPGSIYQPHLFSIDPDTGRYLKSPTHDTYLHAIEGDIKAGYTPYMNVKTGHMYVKPSKKKQGGTVINESDVIAQGGLYIQPTAKDSSDVYYKSKKLQDYFKNKGYQSQGTTKLPYNDSNIFKRELDRLYGQFINQQSTNYPTSTGGSTSSKLDPKYYRKPTNPNKPTIIEQRESQFGTLDTRAPFGYYDTRIVPKEMSSYKNVNMKDPLRGDEVNIPIYDVSVKPYAMRTPAEQAEVERKYGKPKPIVKPVFKDQQEADYPKSNSKAETVQSSDYSKYLNLTPEDVLDKYSFDEYSKAFGLDPVTMRNQINKSIKWDKISNLGEFDTEKFLTRKLYDYIQDNPPKAQKGLNKERKYGLSESDKQRILKEAERTKYQLTKPSGFMTNNPNWYKNSDLLEENIAEFFDPTGVTSHDDAYRAYKEWNTSGNKLPNSNQALDMFGAVPALGKFGKLKYLSNYYDLTRGGNNIINLTKPIYKYLPWQKMLNTTDTGEDISKENIYSKQRGGIIHESSVINAQKGFRLPTGEYVSEPAVVTAPKMSMYEKRVKGAGKDSERYRNLGRNVATLFSNAAEVTGVPGALRFVNNPKKNIKGALNTIDNFILSGSQSMPISVIQQTPYREEDTQAFFNALDAAGLLTAGLSLSRQPIQTAGRYKKLKTPIQNFKSEIDWSKWNLETPNYPELINEYNAIEEATKKAGTWMKNFDGSVFQGTPEQFIQQQSSYFKKAFPEGYNEVWRGANNDPMINKNNMSVFTANKNLARKYTGIDIDKFYNPNIKNAAIPGKNLFNLAHKKSPNSFELNFSNDFWVNLPLETKDKLLLDITNDSKKVLQQYRILKKTDPELYSLIKDSATNKLQKNRYKLQGLRNLKENDKTLLETLRKKLGNNTTTDDLAKYLEEHNIDYAKLNNIEDGGLGDVTIVNHKPGNYLKSLIGNVGFFDMSNPNIYKSLIPSTIATGAALSQEKKLGGLIHESDVIKAQKGENVTIDGKKYKINSSEYRKLYYDNSIASLDAEGIPTFYKDESIWDDYLEEQRKNKVANAVREGTGKFARGVMSGANYAGEVMGTPAALALEALSGRRDFQSALPNIDRSNKMFGLPYNKENLPSNEQLSPSSALGITNPYLSIPIDLAADYATGKILSNPKKYIKGVKAVPFDSPSHVYNTDINKPVQRYETYRWSEKNPETNWYDVYEKEFPIDLIPTRDPISDPYQKIKMKSILRRDEGITWPITDYLRTKKILPKEQWDISDVLSDPNTGLLQDGNTRYWLNKRYNPSFGLGDNKYKIENRISNLRKNNFEDLKPLYSSDEPIKSQWINKQSGGIINESDVIKYKSGGNHGGLDRWFAEKWVDVKTGKECGRQEGEKRKSYPACRPSVRVTSKTPKTASELSSVEKEKFKRSKTSSQRINYQHKRNK